MRSFLLNCALFLNLLLLLYLILDLPNEIFGRVFSPPKSAVLARKNLLKNNILINQWMDGSISMSHYICKCVSGLWNIKVMASQINMSPHSAVSM